MDELEKKINRKIKKEERNEKINWFKIQNYLTIGIRAVFMYFVCFYIFGYVLSDYFSNNYSYLIAFIIGTLTNIYLIIKILKE